MTLTGISSVTVALGALLLLLGIVLLAKRIKIVGIIVAGLGLGVIAIPVLTYLYVATVMR